MNSTRIAAAVTAVLGLVFVGQAVAGMRPDDRSGPRRSTFSSQVAYPDAVERAVANHMLQVGRPDDRSGLRGPILSGRDMDSDAVDRVVANHRRSLVRSAQPTPVPRFGESFDWEAAGVGASTTAVLLLGLGAAFGTARRSRSRSAAA
jgi:hypothetical protein